MSTPRFRLTAPAMPEQSLHEAVAALAYRLIAPPAEWACYPAGAIKLPRDAAAKLIRMGLRRSWPDFLVLRPENELCALYGIELKKVGEDLSRTRTVRTRSGAPRTIEGQADRFPLLIAAGMKEIAVCYSTDEVVAAWERWAIPLRGRIAA